jgi:hypothetical protein
MGSLFYREFIFRKYLHLVKPEGMKDVIVSLHYYRFIRLQVN